jgi:hypothetical protein
MFEPACNSGVITVWSERNFRQPATSCRFAFPDWIFATRHLESFRRTIAPTFLVSLHSQTKGQGLQASKKKPPNPIVESVPRLGLGTIKMARHLVASELLYLLSLHPISYIPFTREGFVPPTFFPHKNMYTYLSGVRTATMSGGFGQHSGTSHGPLILSSIHNQPISVFCESPFTCFAMQLKPATG